jgi:exodeoxyribonuclease V alpha subunit
MLTLMKNRKHTLPVKSDPDVAASSLTDWLVKSMQPKGAALVVAPELRGWIHHAYRSVLTGQSCLVVDQPIETDGQFIGLDTEVLKPLCLRTYAMPEGERKLLYLRQMENFEQRLSEVILGLRADRSEPWPTPAKGITEGLSATQAGALRLLTKKSFVIVTGGPGSGKTHLLAKMLRYVLDAAPIDPAGIRLMAPTGRAARIIGEKMKQLKVSPPHAPETIHAFLHNHDEADKLTMVIVDESSMVDLMLFNRLLNKLPKDCTLVLVGDPQQLPSVEVGTVLADISDAVMLSGNRARLAGDYRSSPEIGALADAVMSHVQGAGMDSLQKAWAPYLADLDAAKVVEQAKSAYGPMVEAARAAKTGQREAIAAALAHINDVRVLCSQRHGEYGAVTLSEAIATSFGIDVGRPTDGALIMVTRNDNHNSQLRNGDVGLMIAGKVYFPGYFRESAASGGEGQVLSGPETEFRAFGYNELPDPVLAFATTVHKAQGSEYAHCIAVISQPKEHADFVSKQILYTAITRAKREFHLYADEKVLSAAVNRAVEQASGLRERLSLRG